MRFLWLSISILVPLITVHAVSGQHREEIQLTYIAVAIVALILSISFTISEFYNHRKRENEKDHARLKHERDEDIKKWRKEFLEDTLRIYDVQKESLQRAKDLNTPPVKPTITESMKKAEAVA